MPTPISIARRMMRTLRFGSMGHRRAFSYIFRERYWGDRESVSGPGSSHAQTENIRRELPGLVKRFSVQTFFDAPCGDLHWMRDVLPDLGCRYIGGDIVPEVVEMARRNCPVADADFLVFDLLHDRFPEADLWLCRDVLFHLSFANIRQVAANAARAAVPLVLVTSHQGDHVRNRPIATGDFRHLNLFRPPFRLRDDQVLWRVDDYVAPAPPRELLLLRREDFVAALG